MAVTAQLDIDDIRFIGQDLTRPECVLCTAEGYICVSDWNGGVTLLLPGGNQQRILSREESFAVRPNGICLQPDGSFLLAHLGDDDGGVYRLSGDGALEAVLTEVDGAALPPTNFVYRDHLGRIWITVSTRLKPRARDYRPDAQSGFIVLLDERGARIAADDLGYANECLVDPAGEFLFVNETFGRRLSRFTISADGTLSDKRTIYRFGAGDFPDGLVLDNEGCFWVTSIVSNRVIRIDRDGRRETFLEDSDPRHVSSVEEAFRAHAMDRPHLDQIASKCLRNISSLAFGGPDLRTAYLGCLLGDRLAYIRAPVAGLPPPHWSYRPALPQQPGA